MRIYQEHCKCTAHALDNCCFSNLSVLNSPVESELLRQTRHILETRTVGFFLVRFLLLNRNLFLAVLCSEHTVIMRVGGGD